MESFPEVAPARPDEWANAFQLIFQYLAAGERDVRVSNALRLVRAGEIDAGGIWVYRNGPTLTGAVVCLATAGGGSLIWPPQVKTGQTGEQIEDALMQAALAWLHGRRAVLTQALLGPEESNQAGPLLRAGFRYVTNLWYLRHDLIVSDLPDLRMGDMKYLPYSQIDAREFHDTLLRSYEGTEDCPELNGVRSIDEIIAGHQAQGKHDPGRWWLLLARGHAVGVLLLAEMPDWQSLDISYIGIIPEARRQGHGRLLVQWALREARLARMQQLTLAVDSRNTPAWRLYHDLGFELFDRRDVYLAVWKTPVK